MKKSFQKFSYLHINSSSLRGGTMKQSLAQQSVYELVGDCFAELRKARNDGKPGSSPQPLKFNHPLMKKFVLINILIAVGLSVNAQQRTNTDTTKKTVTITSSYKPTIKPASKINFSAATLPADSSRPRLIYNVPAQNLFFTYQPASLKPLALSIDTAINWVNSNYIKLGLGNYSTPYAE
ncbi:MAG: hypothetical protein H0U39_12400, partial [Segetibacter sp.]|nr:hypothetical protein [Segetibacter sp.]